MKSVRTRIAPSPTGENLHVGNAYTAYINYIFAKKHHGQFIVRIEDTDQTRLVTGSEKRILESLSWLGLNPDESPLTGGPHAPYRQSERLDLYKKYALELIPNHHAYYCFCTRDRLEKMRSDQEANHKPPMYDGLCKKLTEAEVKSNLDKGKDYVIRLDVPESGITEFTDLIRGRIQFENKLIDDQVLIKSDGYPTYHLGVVVDDHIMQISHIVRGEEWISSTPKHILLYKFFGWDLPEFAHVSVLRNPDRSKLSKRKNPVWVSHYRREGILPEALKNYFATLAWSHPQGKTVFSPEEMMEVFDLKQIQTTAPIFDIEKLRWLNGEYLRQKTEDDMVSLLCEFYPHYSDKKDMLRRIIPLLRERMKTLSEFESLGGFFFKKPDKLEKPVEDEQKRLLKQVLVPVTWSHEEMEKAMRAAAEENNLKAKDLFMSLRILVTGKSVGPPLLESMMVLGKEESLARIGQTG